MGKKVGSDEPGQDEECAEDQEGSSERVLEGDFAWPDGSEYSGQYIVKNEKPVLHGRGRLQMGPEVFNGIFDNGMYLEGTCTGTDGSAYKGSFHNNLFHGPGEFSWADGKIYKGMWEEGLMHGHGEFNNFSYGVDRVFEGLSVRGSFESCIDGQEKNKREFLADYGKQYKESALAALQDIISKTCPAKIPDPAAKKGGGNEDLVAEIPKEYLVPAGSEGETGEGGKEVCDLVRPPFPDLSTLKVSTLSVFGGRFSEGCETPGVITVVDSCSTNVGSFNVPRLLKPQLRHVGQAVAFIIEDPEPAALSCMVFVNAYQEHEVSKAKWKLVHVDENPQIS